MKLKEGMKLKQCMKLRVNLGPATMRKGVRIVSVRAATQAQRTPGDPGRVRQGAGRTRECKHKDAITCAASPGW